MKRTLLLALFFLLSLSTFGQKIYFTDTSNKWHVYSSGGIPTVSSNTIYYYFGDTIIYGIVYNVMDSGYYPVFYREDTLLKKVFAIANNVLPVNDTSECLLYDYNLQIGDTFKCAYANHIVTNIDSVTINGIWHKTWHLEPDSMYVFSEYYVIGYDVIEGIGSLTGPYFPLFPMIFEGDPFLTCFNNNGTTPLVSPGVIDTIGFDNLYFDNASSCTLGINQLAKKSSVVTVVPNPINETSKIVFSYNISSGSLIVLNDIGQTIINTTFQNQDAVIIGDNIRMPGIYYYRVTDNGSGKVFAGKFVSQ